jgi:hypothetical protein
MEAQPSRSPGEKNSAMRAEKSTDGEKHFIDHKKESLGCNSFHNA